MINDEAKDVHNSEDWAQHDGGNTIHHVATISDEAKDAHNSEDWVVPDCCVMSR